LGGFAAVLLESHTKQKSDEHGKQKEHDLFNLNRYQYGVEARVGIKFVEIFCRYSIDPLFRTGDGPDLNSLVMGVRVVSM
jgi:hypothetical protein